MESKELRFCGFFGSFSVWRNSEQYVLSKNIEILVFGGRGYSQKNPLATDDAIHLHEPLSLLNAQRACWSTNFMWIEDCEWTLVSSTLYADRCWFAAPLNFSGRIGYLFLSFPRTHCSSIFFVLDAGSLILQTFVLFAGPLNKKEREVITNYVIIA